MSSRFGQLVICLQSTVFTGNVIGFLMENSCPVAGIGSYQIEDGKSDETICLCVYRCIIKTV